MKSNQIQLAAILLGAMLLAETSSAIADCNPPPGKGVDDAIWQITNDTGPISPSQLLASFGLTLDSFSELTEAPGMGQTFAAITAGPSIEKFKLATHAVNPGEFGPRQTITITFTKNFTISSENFTKLPWTAQQPQYNLIHVLEAPKGGRLDPVRYGTSFRRQFENGANWVEIGLGCTSTLEIRRFYAPK